MTNKEALNILHNSSVYHPDYLDALNMAIKSLEEQKTGYWIPLGNYDDWGNENSYKCSECGELNFYPDNYCHNCGAKIIESQESEDKE